MSGGGSDDGDEEWMPPDDSPLVSNEVQLGNQPSTFAQEADLNDLAPLTFDDIPEGEIDIIDLEATLNNNQNQQYLQGEPGQSESASSGYDVELSDSSWTEILRELRDEGQTEMMDRLVQDYHLQHHLAALDADVGGGDNIDSAANDAHAKVEDDDDWDEEFEQSLQGLPREELIDELIENSMELSQLEMEIISQDMDRAEQDGGEVGLDHGTLDDIDLSDSESYRDFRTMVWDDYQEKKRARMKGRGVDGEGEGETNWSTKSDFSEYPTDWKDFDSSAAFQRDFKEDEDSWVPPSSQFIPSTASVDESENPEKNDGASASDLDNTIDWLQARRTRLGEDDPNSPRPTHLMTPEQAETFRHQNSQVPVKLHTLLTTTELSTSLSAQGGTEIHIIDTTHSDSRHDVGIGCRFIMLVTGRNSSHVRVLADSVVRNLKARKLSERGVMGAMQGAEGGQDIFSNKRSRNRARRNGALNSSKNIDDEWIVVDCDNIHVHVLEETTRKCLNIEGLWDLSNPDSDGSKLRRVNCDDEDEMDVYVAENPIPDEYAAKVFNDGGSRTNGWISGGAGGRVQAVVPVPFQKKSFSEKWTAKPKSKRSRNRRRKGPVE